MNKVKKLIKKVSVVTSFIIASSLLSGAVELYHIVSPKGKIVATVEYENIYGFEQNLALVELKRKYGYIDTTGKVVIPLIYQRAESFTKYGLALIQKNDLYGFINKTGKEVIKPIYTEASSFHDNGLTSVKLDDKWGVIDKTGKIIIPINNDYVRILDKFFIIENNGRVALFSSKAKPLTPFIYDSIHDLPSFYEENYLIPFKKDDKWGFINQQGKEIVKAIYTEVGKPSQGILGVIKESKLGYINLKTGKPLTEFIYNHIDEFSEGLAAVKKGDKWGYINTNGKIVIPMIYDSAYKFSDGVAYVTKNGKTIYINKQNKEITPPKDKVFDNTYTTHYLKRVDKKGNYSITYPNLNLKVERFYEADNGNAKDGKIYDLSNKNLIADNVIFREGKITKGNFYYNGKKILIEDTTGFYLSEINEKIAKESTKPNNNITRNPSNSTITPEKNKILQNKLKSYLDLLGVIEFNYKNDKIFELVYKKNSSNRTKEDLVKINEYLGLVDKLISGSDELIAINEFKTNEKMLKEVRSFKDKYTKQKESILVVLKI